MPYSVFSPRSALRASRFALDALAEPRKKTRYALSFARQRLVHTNLQLLYQCNFRCRICDFWKPSFTSAPQLSLDQVRIISNKLNRIGPQIVSIGGGEPLLHPDLVPIVAELAQHHFPVMICNGWFVTPEVARALFQAGIHEISISVDYADPARHDAQRGMEGAFERALGALQVLHQSRVHSWQRVHMISVVMDDNVDDIEPLVRLCRELGITYLVTLYSDARGRAEQRATQLAVGRRILELQRAYPEFVQLRGYVARFEEAIEQAGIGPCYAGKNLCNIDSQGSVTLCIDRLDDPVGNILTDDIDEIEKGLLERYRSNECRSCWTSCRGTIETLMYGSDKMKNLRDYYDLVRPVEVPVS